jgi:uncharacterized protein (UPF0332 family)
MQHYRTIQALPLILGEKHEQDAKYLDTCRSKRNVAEYDYIGAITEEDVSELVRYAEELRDEILNWLSKHHADFL